MQYLGRFQLVKVVVSIAILAFWRSDVQALGLLESYQLALESDPKIRSARSDRLAEFEFEAIGRANLMPNISASYGISKNDAVRTVTGPNGARQSDNPQYDSRTANISFRQPIFNWEAWARFKSGKIQVIFSEAKFDSESQDLIARLTVAYLESQLAEDQLRLAIAQRDAYQENQIANQQMFDKGAGTRTDVLETQARFQMSLAVMVEAQDNVANKRNELSAIIGVDPGHLDRVDNCVPDLSLTPDTLDAWERLARANNPELLAQTYSVDQARNEIERSRAGHYPRIDLVVSHSRNTADSLFTYNQESTINSIGVQMSIPLYNGGSMDAQVRQANARLVASQANLDTVTKKTLLELRRQFQMVSSTRTRVSAIEFAERSATEALEATRMSVVGGQRVNLDVLTAFQQLYKTRRDLAEARHGYLLAYLRLHAAAGVLDRDTLTKIASCFKPTQ
jgi:protease secretion system outer membrane protein